MELDGDNGLSGWTSARILRVVAEEVPGEVETFFSRLEAEHGTPDGKGFLSELSTHFANYCRSRTGLGIALNRPSEPLPRMWRSEEWCVTRVSAVDNDRDGEMEIAFNDQGGGSGTFAVRENFLHWPMDAPAPARGFEYGTLQVDQTGTPSTWLQRTTMRGPRETQANGPSTFPETRSGTRFF